MMEDQRIEMRLSGFLLERIDQWSDSQGWGSRSRAIRELLELALADQSSSALFQLMRFQVLSFALTKEGQGRLTSAYLFAWQRGVFPVYDNVADWHLPFEAHFTVRKRDIEALTATYADWWDAGVEKSFYDVEDHFRLSYGNPNWDRSKLIVASRYLNLSGSFDQKFWSSLLRPTEYPTEAATISRGFDPKEDVYLM